MVKPLPSLKPSSTADRVANILRERILRTPEDDYIGSEAELATEIGVSLPTLRQAARMLEYEQLLKIKPGKGGGYFSRRPAIETAIKSASQFLSSKDLISTAMFMDCADVIVEELVTKAVHCDDKSLREGLAAFIESQHELLNGDVLPADSFKFSTEMMTLFAEMSGNILMNLFSRILWNEISISYPARVGYEDTQDLLRKNYETRLELAEAVMSRDEKRAFEAWRKRSKFLRAWPQRGNRPSTKKSKRTSA